MYIKQNKTKQTNKQNIMLKAGINFPEVKKAQTPQKKKG